MNGKLKIQTQRMTTEDLLVAFIFISYFCSEVLRSFTARVFVSGIFDIVYNVFFAGGVFLIFLTKKRKRLFVPALIYLLISILFLVTFFFHPEYKDWYFNLSYGIQVQFFRAVGGIWAFLVVYLVPEREKLVSYLRISCWLLFAYLFLKFVSAQIRGYWVYYEADYSRVESRYNLGFGYAMLFPVLFFAAEAYLSKKKRDYIPFIIGAITILFGGSRGAIIWVGAVFLFMVPYKWNMKSKKQKVRTIIFIVLFVPVVLLLFFNYELVLQEISAVLSKRGFSSRTLETLMSGDFSDPNGRDTIYQIVIERIKEGGLFGNGVFGERIAVGQQFRWGYAHNIILEIYAAFGYIGGTIVCLGLIVGVIKTARRCRDTAEQIVFLTFLTASMKLFLSDSFWFNRSFWGLLAIMIMWRKNSKQLKNVQGTILEFVSSF